MEIEVYSFGENAYDKWYADKEGNRNKCDEDTIDKLWNEYMIHPEAGRSDSNEHIIFTIKNTPIKLTI